MKTLTAEAVYLTEYDTYVPTRRSPPTSPVS